MKKLSLPDPESFSFKDVTIAGDECVLIIPKEMGVAWTEDNKYFRSSIWRKSDMYPVSLGFRKFMNYGEKPEFEPLQENDKIEVIRKIDGSCLIVSKYKEELIIRTRGTVDATKLENGQEIAQLIAKYPKAFDNGYLNSENYTLLFEWTTPSNRIVLTESKEPTLWLIGAVAHTAEFRSFYRYVLQSNLDSMAKEFGVERPETFEIDLNQDIKSLQAKIEPLQDIEGVVVYSCGGQVLKKIKTLRYLQLHRVFTGVKTVDHLFDLFVEYGQPQRENFEALLATNFDWELVVTLESLMDELYNKIRLITYKIMQINVYLINPDFMALDRKGKAQKILEMFPNDSGIAFAFLDRKDISPHKLWKAFTSSDS
jgi:hypothetical protein